MKFISLHCHTLVRKKSISIITPNGEEDILNFVTNNKRGRSMSLKNISNCVTPINEVILDEHKLHLNHYPHQSKQFYFGVKAKRGNAHGNGMRGMDLFGPDEEAFTQFEDDELSRKKRYGKHTVEIK